MKTVNINRNDEIKPIEWQPYAGETIIVKTIIRGGKKIQETGFYEDRVKATPRGNAYVIGNGPSRKNFDLNLLKDSGQVYVLNKTFNNFLCFKRLINTVPAA